MDALYYLVIATLVLTGAWVGYHASEEFMMDDGSYEKAEPHGTIIIVPEDHLLMAYVHGVGPASSPRGS